MEWDYTDEASRRQAANDPVWELERLIVYGLRGGKISAATLQRHLPALRIPADRRAFLELLLWNKPF